MFTLLSSVVLLIYGAQIGRGTFCIDGLHLGASSPDFVAEVNYNASISCTLAESTLRQGIDSSMIFFKLGNKTLDAHTESINQSTSVLNIPSVSRSDDGTYFCYVRFPNKTEQLVCSTTLSAGVPPGPIPVSDFECHDYDFKNLTCHWKPGDFGIRTNYYLEELEGFPFNLPRTCGVSLNNGCYWTRNTSPNLRLKQNLHLRLVSNNSLGQYLQYFYLDHYDIIQPDRPVNFKVIGATPTSVTLQWNASDGLLHEEKLRKQTHYELSYHPKENPSEIVVEHLGNRTSYTVSKLIPYTAYTFFLRSRVSQDTAKKYWSLPASIDTSTAEDIPYDCPQLIAYEAYEPEKGQRKVTVYWKKDHLNANAPDPHYILLANNKEKHGNLSRENFKHTLSLGMVEYRLEMYAENKVGKSRNSSHLIIPEQKELPEKPTQVAVLVLGDNRYEVSWNYKFMGATWFTIFYCRSNEINSLCTSELYFKQVRASNQKNYTQDILLNGKEVHHRFAVSAENVRFSSPLAWSDCYQNFIGGPLPTLIIKQLLSDDPNRVVIKYKELCTALESHIGGVDVEYRDMTSNLTERIIKGYKKDEIILENLNPATKYSIRIRLVDQSRFGKNGSFSEAKNVTTQHGEPNTVENLVYYNLSDTGVSLMWQTAVRGEVDWYDVEVEGVNITYKNDGETCDLFNCRVWLDDLRGYTNYTIKVHACKRSLYRNKEHRFCSRNPAEIKFETLTGAPGTIEAPRIDSWNSTHVLIKWKPPLLLNGPKIWYLVHVRLNGTNDDLLIHQTNSTELYQEVHCSDGTQLDVAIQGVNYRDDGSQFPGHLSDWTTNTGCLPIANGATIATKAAVIGVACAFAISICVLVSLVKWMKKKINEMKAIKIKLPDGLTTGKLPDLGDPTPNKIKSFKSDASLEKADSVEIESLCKNRHNSGTSQGTECSTDGLLPSADKKPKHFQRTYSDQSAPENGHESVSSNSTCATQVSSVDSGAVDDRNDIMSFTSESSSSNGPNQGKPGDRRRSGDRGHSESSGSKDSGLDVSSNDNRRLKDKNKKNRLKDLILDKPPNILQDISALSGSEPSLCYKLHGEYYREPPSGNRLATAKYAQSIANLMEHPPKRVTAVTAEQRRNAEKSGRTPDNLTLRDNYVSHDMMKFIPFSKSAAPPPPPPSKKPVLPNYVAVPTEPIQTSASPAVELAPLGAQVNKTAPSLSNIATYHNVNQSKTETPPEESSAVQKYPSVKDFSEFVVDPSYFVDPETIIESKCNPVNTLAERCPSPKLVHSKEEGAKSEAPTLRSPYVNLSNDIELVSTNSWKSYSPPNTASRALAAPSSCLAQPEVIQPSDTSIDTIPQSYREKSNPSSGRPPGPGLINAGNGYVLLANTTSALPSLSEAGLDSVV